VYVKDLPIDGSLPDVWQVFDVFFFKKKKRRIGRKANKSWW
jgi:hypothetical protein